MPRAARRSSRRGRRYAPYTVRRRRQTTRVGRRRPRYVTRGIITRRTPFVHRVLGGFPPRRTVALRYCETIALNPGDGSASVNVFCVNNIFDPNFSGGGHQPMFYDNYANLYAKYKVNYATITMVCLDNHVVNTTIPNLVSGSNVGQVDTYNNNQRSARMFILVDESTSDYPSDLDNLIEEGNKRMKWRYVVQNTSAQLQKLSFRARPNKNMNLSYNDHTLAANFGAGPARPLYFICGVDSFDTENADSMKYQFIITYNVTMFDFIGNQAQN
jgi:hypothetical protein